MSFLIPEVFVILAADLILLVFLTFAVVLAIGIARHWNLSDTSERQYRLEKRSVLVSVLVKYALAVKIPMFLLFIYSLDKLANLLPGAMCAAGTLNATPYAKYLLYLTVFNIYLSACWLVLDRCDGKSEIMPYTRLKNLFIPVIYVFFCAELALFILNFASIDPQTPVSCCTAIFSSDTSPLMTLSGRNSAIIFCANFVLMIAAYFFRRYFLYGLLNTAFIFTSVLSLILFTGTYVYELPTHLCPFCLLQSGYHYVGYLFYVLLFIGTFCGLSSLMMRAVSGLHDKKMLNLSVIFNSFYFLLSVYYPLSYYIRNHTWL